MSGLRLPFAKAGAAAKAPPRRAAPRPAARPLPSDQLPFWKRPIGGSGGPPKLGRQARATMIRQMATLAAVMPISDAVATLARQPGKATDRQILASTNRALQGGASLAAALPANAFPSEIRATVAAGEASGRLPLLLTRLADTLEADAALRSRLISSLSYPLLLVVVAVVVILAMLAFVVPSIAEQLTESGQPLPLLTRVVLAIADFVRLWWLAGLVLLVVAGLALWLVGRRPEAAARRDRFILAMPLVGGWVAAIEGVRWARLVSTMLSAGLPLAEALSLTASTLGTRPWRDATQQVAAQVRAGSSLSASLSLLPRPPGLLVALTQSGEASGRLALLLDSAASTLDRQIADRSRTALALAEPVIILTLGGLVGLIILSVLLPILQLNTLAGTAVGGF